MIQKLILTYTKSVLAVICHSRARTKRILTTLELKKYTVLMMYYQSPLMVVDLNGSLGSSWSNKANRRYIKTISHSFVSLLLNAYQEKMKEKTGKTLKYWFNWWWKLIRPGGKFWELSDSSRLACRIQQALCRYAEWSKIKIFSRQ